MHAQTQDHLKATYSVLRYLKSCLGKGILYKRYGHCQVEVYIDAEEARNIQWLASLVLRLNSYLWPVAFVNHCG